jgi:hypothetical protein
MTEVDQEATNGLKYFRKRFFAGSDVPQTHGFGTADGVGVAYGESTIKSFGLTKVFGTSLRDDLWEYPKRLLQTGASAVLQAGHQHALRRRRVNRLTSIKRCDRI